MKPEIPAYLITALCIIAMTILSVANKSIPPEIPYLAVGALTGAAGVTVGGITTGPPKAAAAAVEQIVGQ